MNFTDKVVVGRPNLGSRSQFFARVNEILDRKWLSNHGPVVEEFEAKVAQYLGVKHAVSVCNATLGLQVAIRAMDLSGEVIVPSFTFIATPHALQWQGVKPVFCDINPRTHNIDPDGIQKLVTNKTSGILGVHIWGRACDTAGLQNVAGQHDLRVMYDASHAFGCSHEGKMIGNFGSCEVFSFHATKFINALEGGVITTNEDDLADRMRKMSNFGFSGFDQVDHIGINAKMNEVSAAMGLVNLEAVDQILETNLRNYERYRERIALMRGVELIEYDSAQKNNYQYIVLEVDPERARCGRDHLHEALNAENVLARKYFWPGCHRLEPYRTLQPEADSYLGKSNILAERVLVLPTGQSVDAQIISKVCDIIDRELHRFC